MTNPNQLCDVLLFVCSKMADGTNLSSKLPVADRTSKFHGEFMSPALFLVEVLKMVKLTRGPLVLYHLPKY